LFFLIYFTFMALTSDTARTLFSSSLLGTTISSSKALTGLKSTAIITKETKNWLINIFIRQRSAPFCILVL
jgi:hypothetical protein